MKFYKIIKEDNNEFIGIGSSQDLRCFQNKHKVLLNCFERNAQYISCNGKLYRDSWMRGIDPSFVECEFAKIYEISEEEYNSLFQVIESGEDIIIEDADSIFEEPVEEEIPIEEQLTIEFVKNKKIAQMNSFCKQAIISGVDVLLENGMTYHFDLTVEDQLNINGLKYSLLQGETQIAFHSEGGIFKYYSRKDIQSIVSAADNHILYHNSYFNSLKNYINSLTDIIEVSSIYYGQDFPDYYKSEILLSFKGE